jgi:hypothetical protein
MDYAAGGVGGKLAKDVHAWALENGGNPLLRIALCGYEERPSTPLSTSIPRREQLAAAIRVQQKRAARRANASLALARPYYAPPVTVLSHSEIHYLIDNNSRTIASLADPRIASAIADFLNS